MPRKYTTVKIIRNNIKTVGAKVHQNLAERVDRVTEQGRDKLSEAMKSGALPLQPDTIATAESLAIQTKSKSDFDDRRSAAKTAYTTNASRYSEAVQRELDPSAYSAEHFDERAAAQAPPLSQGKNVTRGAILTMLVWGLYWEFGHNNFFTGKNEHRPWFYPWLLEWAAREAAESFRGLAE